MNRVFIRQLSSLAQPLPKVGQGQYLVPNTQRYKKLMEKQALFSRDDGLLVWQKLPADKPIYATIIALVSTGVLWSVFCLAKFASPPKNK